LRSQSDETPKKRGGPGKNYVPATNNCGKEGKGGPFGEGTDKKEINGRYKETGNRHRCGAAPGDRLRKWAWLVRPTGTMVENQKSLQERQPLAFRKQKSQAIDGVDKD